MSLETFTQAAIEALLWSTIDVDGDHLDANFDASHLAPSALAKIKADCAAFYTAHGELFTEENCTYRGCPEDEYAGHDFILTRNGHGAGFWDGDWAEPAGFTLTTAARSAGEIEAYVGEDGLIYLSGFETFGDKPTSSPEENFEAWANWSDATE